MNVLTFRSHKGIIGKLMIEVVSISLLSQESIYINVIDSIKFT